MVLVATALNCQCVAPGSSAVAGSLALYLGGYQGDFALMYWWQDFLWPEIQNIADLLMPKFSFLPIGFPDAHSGAKLRVFTVVSVSRNNCTSRLKSAMDPPQIYTFIHCFYILHYIYTWNSGGETISIIIWIESNNFNVFNIWPEIPFGGKIQLNLLSRLSKLMFQRFTTLSNL